MKRLQQGIAISIGSMTGIFFNVTSGMAQISEVPEPNNNGDFMTAKVMGNRGYYNNRIWLVVDPENLNCRDTPGGKIKTQLTTGATMTAIFSQEGREDAIVMRNSKPWLRVRSVNPNFNTDSGTCYVRANIKYVFPINNDYLKSLN
ncbi:hypothetical protein [Lyngbya sp. PCC 8106]|uniref:hypothetical protein n=1 Tax=Lyngbya sp. (strain PCC 8106) TaxID=313612 RepID=UPI000587ACAC|nr:hypothetical protein [Lyngbya sp. PCC 8106]